MHPARSDAPVVHTMARDAARVVSAEAYYLAYDFGDDVVEASNGWERTSGDDTWRRTVFVERDVPGEDTIARTFAITFLPGTAVVADGDTSFV